VSHNSHVPTTLSCEEQTDTEAFRARTPVFDPWPAPKAQIVAVSLLGLVFVWRVANTSVDRVEAYKWYSLALQGGHTTAARNLSLLKRLMSADQLKTAERKIEEFARGRPHDSRS
jgi:hypothetical protein